MTARLNLNAIGPLTAYEDAAAAVHEIRRIYDQSLARIGAGFRALVADPQAPGPVEAPYPYVAFSVAQEQLNVDARLSHGVFLEPGIYGTTLTRPDIFGSYYHEQISRLMHHHGCAVHVGPSATPIPLAFAAPDASGAAADFDYEALLDRSTKPDLWAINDAIANSTNRPLVDAPNPLSLFTAERVDYSIARLHHYTGTAPGHFQSFVLFTNYQRYADAFVAYARAQLAAGEVSAFVGPGDIEIAAGGTIDPDAFSRNLPQMPAYHIKRPDGDGITLVNIGVGPSNAKTITDHIAVLRPHCWLMVGHCAGLRRGQVLGDYVLAHGYVRADHVLDDDLPLWVPVPAIAEVQVALAEATSLVTGLRDHELKTRLRTGTVATTDNRNWEIQLDTYFAAFNRSRAIAVDMESATVAANGFRFRVPYGTLLCVSDRPLHGQLKLRGMANEFYRTSIDQHIMIGIETMNILRRQGVERLHSRKLRGFVEPGFR
ncbi:MAG: AMP nucleosidase [Proteobacteria bacterium]|nr:AMP nucleosidase [Pseudomonadota bacterium]